MLPGFMQLPPQKKNMYRALYEQIKSAVMDGALSPGDRLPSLREAAAQLGVSRTTVENAYVLLCLEGYAESSPQRGYFVREGQAVLLSAAPERPRGPAVRFDFSSSGIDPAAADTAAWKKAVRAALNKADNLTTYGDPAGEPALRRALAEYAFRARGVKADPDRIVVGAGAGTLLTLLCGLMRGEMTVGMENGGFRQAELIFSDYGVPCRLLPSDESGVLPTALDDSFGIFFSQPSALSKVGLSSLAARRNALLEWLYARDGRMVLEDDYNGELRYTARSVGAFQGRAADRTVYLGSFSKLMLPSVRIAYMVLPEPLAMRFSERSRYYNQTCGKTEQTALCEYIADGHLERQLRRLRKLYAAKSRILLSALQRHPALFRQTRLFEGALTVQVQTPKTVPSARLCEALREKGVLAMLAKETGAFRLSFAGIRTEDIEAGVEAVFECLG